MIQGPKHQMVGHRKILHRFFHTKDGLLRGSDMIQDPLGNKDHVLIQVVCRRKGYEILYIVLGVNEIRIKNSFILILLDHRMEGAHRKNDLIG